MSSANSAPGGNGAGGTNPGWCSICNVSITADTAAGHYESRTHLNRCLQKGVGISLVPSSGIKEGEKSSTWCSVCNQALESASVAEHYESRAHLNKCLQRGVGIPLTYATSTPSVQPTGPRYTQATTASNPPPPPPPQQVGATGGCFSFGSQQNRPRPRMAFNQGGRPTSFGGKKYPFQAQQTAGRGQTQSNPRMAVMYGGGYGQDMRQSEGWQKQSSSVKNGWPYCEICDQVFQSVGALSQHCSTSGHLEVKSMKQNQYHGVQQSMSDQPRFSHQGSAGNIRGQNQGQGQYFANQGASQDSYHGAGPNQGMHYANKEWRPFNRTVQFFS